MIRTIEAVIDKHGDIRLLEDVNRPNARRALVTILEEEPAIQASEAALMSEAALSEDWNRPEEDDAWSHLQPDRYPRTIPFLRPFEIQDETRCGPCEHRAGR